MIVFALLAALFALAHLPPLGRLQWLAGPRGKMAAALGLALIFAGLLHFLQPAPFLAMMPPFLPWHRKLVQVSGAAEIAVGFGLLVPRLRRVSAWAAVALLAAVFPANIYAAVSQVEIPGYPSAAWYRWLRLPMQGVLIGCALAVKPRA